MKKNIYKKGNIRNLTFMVAGMLLMMLSCCKDSEDLDKQVPAAIKVATKVTADEDPDNVIKTLRIMAFDRGSTIRNNIFYDEAYLNSNNPIIHEMLSGIYDFVFIANEEPDGSENAELTASAFGNNKMISSLNAISIPASRISTNTPIPMLTQIDNVTVLPGFEGIKINNGATQTTWSVLMKRLAVRIDMTLKSQVDLTTQFKGITFSNIPDNIPLLGSYSGALNETKSYTILNNAENFEITTVPDYLWAIKIKRIILPSNTFTPEDMVSRSLKMTLELSPWNEESPSAVIGIDEPFNYTLPPNTHFMGEGIIGPLLDLNLNAFDWDTNDILGDINGRILNVSAVSTSISLTESKRIYFYTNQKEVSINPQGYLGASFFDVNNIFENLIGSNPFNIHLDTSTGAGYVDLIARPSVTESGIYVIYLNAGGLIRTLSVDISTR